MLNHRSSRLFVVIVHVRHNRSSIRLASIRLGGEVIFGLQGTEAGEAAVVTDGSHGLHAEEIEIACKIGEENVQIN
jgi:hypothetical protein